MHLDDKKARVEQIQREEALLAKQAQLRVKQIAMEKKKLQADILKMRGRP